MLKYFKIESIKNKIISIIVLICFFIIFIGFLFFIPSEIAQSKKEKVNSASMNAKLIGEYCITSLDFNYQETAKSIIQKAEILPDLVNVILYNSDTVFAYTKNKIKFQDIPIDLEISNYKFIGDYLNIIEPIIYKDKKYGSIYLKINTGIIKDIKKTILIISLIGFILLTIAYFLSNTFQKIISKPILTLADIAQKVSNSHDYSIRIKRNTNDEVGILYDEFNEMLKVIQEREDELKISESRFRNVFNSQHDAIFVHDIYGNIIDVNDTMLKMYNVTRDEALTFSFANDYSSSKNSLAMTQKRWKNALKGDLQEFEWEARRPKDGSTFDVQVNLHKISLGDENTVLSTVRDVTVRKKAENELKKAQNYISNILNSMPSIIIGVDNKGSITQWNNFAEVNTGIKASDAKGNNLQTIFPELQLELDKIKQSIKTRQTFINAKMKRKVANKIKVEDIIVYPLIANGVEGAVIRVDDVTDKVRMEEMIIQSEKMLSVGGLAAGMAHEINNPLAGIMQNIQVVQNRLLKQMPQNINTAKECGITMESLKEYLDKRAIPPMMNFILSSGERASKIVQNMLSFSRKSEHTMTNNNITQIINNTLDLCSNDYDLKKKYDFKKIEIVKNYKDNLSNIQCEYSKIQQVFLNIFKNAAQAMAEGNESLKIKNQQVKTSQLNIQVKQINKWIRIEIKDNGPGMSQKIQNRIFEPFFTTKKVGAGTGLGLSVSYFIITKDHNGKMTVKSEEGKGTKFIIDLPVESKEENVL